MELIAFPPRARMPNLLIVFASGMGKTMIVEKFARDHPGYHDAANGLKRIPVVVVQMVSGPDEARFYKRLLAAIGATEPPRPTLGLLESVTLRLLGETKPGMLVIDEVHSLQAGTVREQARFLNMLRFSADWDQTRRLSRRAEPRDHSVTVDRPIRNSLHTASMTSRVAVQSFAFSRPGRKMSRRSASSQRGLFGSSRRCGIHSWYGRSGGRSISIETEKTSTQSQLKPKM